MRTYEIEYAGIAYPIEPYNYDDIELSYDAFTDNGARMLIPSISNIELIDNDYRIIYPLIVADKCTLFLLKVYCNGTLEFIGSFNYYSSEFDLDRCKLTLQITRYMPNFDRLLEEIDEEYNMLNAIADEKIQSVHYGYKYTRAKRLTTIINYLTTRAGVTWSSKFLQSFFTPMTFPLGTFTPGSIFEDLEITYRNPFYKTYITPSLTNDDAEMNLSLSKILDILTKQTLNLAWRFNEADNELIIEHVASFESAFQFDNVSLKYILTPISGLDLTSLDGGKWLDETNANTITVDKIYSQERWKPQVARVDVPWGGPLGSSYLFSWRFIYDCAPFTKINEVKLDVETNVMQVETQDESCLLMVTCDDLIDPDGPCIHEEIGGFYLTNYFFTAGVIWVWWQWNRPFLIARRTINTAPQTLKSTTKMRKQTPITFPLCCNTIDEYKTVTTFLGDGYIDNYSINLATEIATINLIYEDV